MFWYPVCWIPFDKVSAFNSTSYSCHRIISVPSITAWALRRWRRPGSHCHEHPYMLSTSSPRWIGRSRFSHHSAQPYFAQFPLLHVTEETVTANTSPLLPLCRNQMWCTAGWNVSFWYSDYTVCTHVCVHECACVYYWTTLSITKITECQ